MKRKLAWALLTLGVLVGASLKYTPSASSSSFNQRVSALRAVPAAPNLMPPFASTFDVDRADDTAAATACTAAPNDCSLRGAIIAANTDVSADPAIINLQPATTYSLTLTNAAQENAAATGDLDITTSLHTVTIIGGGSSGPNASVIDAAGLNVGASRDRAFQIIGPGVNVTFEGLVIQNGQAADDGVSGASTNPSAQNGNRAGGGILNNGGGLTLNNVIVRTCGALGKGDSIVNEHTTLDAWGGGLASLTATGNVNITDSTFTANAATGGDGGIFNNAAGSNARGGSIYFEGGTLNISGSRIEASSADGGNGGDQNQNGQTNGGFGGFAQGGGVWVGGGTVAINNSTFEDTEANGGNSGTGGNGANPGGGADGGGLYSLGNVTVTNSTFHLAEANGGDGGDAFGSTCLGGHMAGDGGGARGGAVFADGGGLNINTATFANNFAAGGNGGDGGQTDGGLNCGNHGAGGLAHGGAITNNAAAVNIKHGTISGNDAQAGNTGVNQGGANKPPRLVAEGTGGGIRVGPGGVTLENTIIAGNTAANGLGDATGAATPGPNVDGTVNSNGHNLLGVATDAGGFSGVGDQTGANPMLAALADNGGPTRTMALTPGSPAIDAGVAAGAAFDQRGKSRTYDDPGVANAATSDGTDIGAFELQPECSLSCPDDVSVSNDPGECGAFVDYTEPDGAGCGTVTCDHPSGSFFPVGDTTVTCTSPVGPTCNFTVTVTDTEAPVITTSGPVTLWPPNHSYATFNVTGLVAGASDNCDSGVGVGSVTIAGVTSDEPDNGGGDGNTINDIVIAADCKSVQLRSERKSKGNGRVYTITFEVTDASGNVSTATAKVTVPHSQNGAAAVDDGPSHTVLSGCS
ncbi:MAG: choice-of-anchor Q domain-containing protein [Pyrinomonadaceae bacterium]